MIFTKKNNNAILPTSATDCFDKRCVNLFVNKTITLHPFSVTEIDFDLMINIPKGYILRIVNHSNNNTWGVITTSIYNHTDDNEIELKVSVMSSIEHTLKSTDILCHLQLLQLDDFFFILKCKYNILCLTFLQTNCLYF
jgi:dUTPase